MGRLQQGTSTSAVPSLIGHSQAPAPKAGHLDASAPNIPQACLHCEGNFAGRTYAVGADLRGIAQAYAQQQTAPVKKLHLHIESS